MRHGLTLLTLSTAMLLSACGSGPLLPTLGKQADKLDITSDPLGAEVYVMGARVGVTPLALDQDLVFPVVYPREQQSLYGVVELRKPGCTTQSIKVGTRAVSKGIQLKLACGDAVAPAVVVSPLRQPAAAPAVEQTAREVARDHASYATRLRQIIELREKGLITEQESREIRQRILGEL